MSADLATVLISVAAAFGTSALTLVATAWVASRRAGRAAAERLLAEADAAIAFLFEDEKLVDATPAARQMLSALPPAGSEWAVFAALLRYRFPDLDRLMATLSTAGAITIPANDESGETLRAEWLNGIARVVISDGDDGRSTERADYEARVSFEAELRTLRAVVRSMPVAVWKQAEDGAVVWANDAYFQLASDALEDDEALSWPPPSLFPVAPGAAADHGTVVAPFRARLDASGKGPERWFDCHGYALGGELLCFALPADGVVRAEEALREFVQTLSKTFADLPIGLAIFDRSRKLALFNPALTDLTTLDIAFLSARPTLFAFLDQLREKRRIPEPRDYRSWRQRMTELEEAAASGFVQENWTLPTGQTFRVTGRPHPDGAVAFLFEDISAEVSLTRRFRSEIELGQTVIDSLEEAICVFSPAGTLSFSNAAYAELWGMDPGTTLAEIGILDATRHWQGLSEPSPVWGDVRDYLAARGERAEWSATVRLKDGRGLDCRFQPLTGGATLVGFTETEAPAVTAIPQRHVTV